VLDRFPRLVVCLPHAGGALPFVIGRIERGWETRPDLRHIALPHLRRFYYDTISYSAPALRYLIDLVGADRVMMGSDYCFKLGYDRPVEVVTHHPQMTDQEKKMVLRGNAERLLGLSN
jgi:aminocarboxymuconate-semialdehyde decarboxylase